MRLLGVVRISDLTDETTSPERQRAKITGYASLHDHELIGVAEDLDVSGSKSPFGRRELGPWLADDKLAEWDALIFSRLDRLTRSLFDFLEVWRRLEAMGKSLICLEPSLDMTTPAGRAFAQVIAVFAEFELETIRARVKDAYDAARQRGSYPGMQMPFGYMPVKRDKGWAYIPDPDYAPVVAEMASRLLAGQSLNHIARWLNDAKVPTSRNIVRIRNGNPVMPSPWKGTTVRKILQSHNLLGATVSNGEPVRDDDGNIASRSEPLIDHATWGQVQEQLESLGGTIGPRVNSSPLLQIAFCGECEDEAPLYVTVTRSGRKTYRYYHCATAHSGGSCSAKRINADELEGIVERQLLSEAGNVKIVERTIIPATDYSADIARLGERVGHLYGRVAAARATGQDVTADEARLAEAQRTLEEYAAKPARPAEVREVPTSKTFAEQWAQMDWPQRNVFLRKSMFMASVRTRPKLTVMMPHIPDLWRHVAGGGDASKPRATAKHP
jgi:site-specific DNA recombinase